MVKDKSSGKGENERAENRHGETRTGPCERNAGGPLALVLDGSPVICYFARYGISQVAKIPYSL